MEIRAVGASSRRYAGIAIIAATAMLLAVPAAWIPPLRMLLVSIMEPALTFFAGPAHGPEVPSDPQELSRKISALQKELDRTRRALIELEDENLGLRRELERFEEYRKLASQTVDERLDRVVYARVIGRSLNWQSYTILINRGSGDGIRPGAGVACGRAAVGVVTECGPRVSKVALLPERGLKIPARILRTGAQGVICGDGSQVSLCYVPAPEVGAGGGPVGEEPPEGPSPEAPQAQGDPGPAAGPAQGPPEPQPGDQIVTSGLAGMFRRGWLIGTVRYAGAKPGESFMTIEVEPAPDFFNVETVMVICIPEGPLSTGGGQ